MTEGMFGWRLGGLLLAICLVGAVYLAKPIGVTTQFVTGTAAIWQKVDKTLIVKGKSHNDYINDNRKKLVNDILHPINYGSVFLLFMLIGGIVSRLLFGPRPANEFWIPKIWQVNFGSSKIFRSLIVFVGGAVCLFGARLAGGCTSGHMMSGIMQQSFSGYLFAVSAFITAVPVAMLMYRK